MRSSLTLTTLLAGGLLLGGCAAETTVTPLEVGPAAEPFARPEPAARPKPSELVAITDFEYAPRRLVVPAGTRVGWPNRDAANHTVTFSKRPPGDLGDVDRGETLTTRFPRAGRFRYVCVYHPAMRGTVVVK